MKYRKKPVVIEAVRWTGLNLEEIKQFVTKDLIYDIDDAAWKVGMGIPVVTVKIKTLEGEMLASIGDYIIKGVDGEFYPCKPDIFEKTYDTVNEVEVSPITSEDFTKTQELLELIIDNPSLPVVPMVDYEIVSDDSCRWLGSFGRSYIGEYALFDEKERYYEDREEFKEDYYDYYCNELYEKFKYEPCITFANDDRFVDEQVAANKENEKRLNKYLDEIADKHFKKAIIVYIDVPDEE